jgi:NAD(P)-dependent dehydrogenase (short-subunit alcohol dehydrogenase family)
VAQLRRNRGAGAPALARSPGFWQTKGSGAERGRAATWADVWPGWGNGKAAAVLFAREGARVFCVDINRAAAEETAGLIAEAGGEAAAYRADVSDGDQVAALVARCRERFGAIDVLQNNVGILEVGGPVEASEESWERVMKVNIGAMFLTCKHVLPVMVEQGRGAIVNIASIAAIRWLGVPYISYAASKGAVAGKGIRANSVLPGLMNTPMIVEPLKQAYAEGDLRKMIEIRDAQCPMGRMGEAWDVAYAALFLASAGGRWFRKWADPNPPAARSGTSIAEAT